MTDPTRKYEVTDDHELVCMWCWEVIGYETEVFDVVAAHYAAEHPKVRSDD